MNYHDRPEISNSDLSLMEKSINHFLNKKHETTPAMEFGSAFHTLILEKEKFNYVVFEGDKRTKEYKSFLAENEGKKIISKTDNDLLLEMEATVWSNPIACELLEIPNEIEKEIFFEFNELKFRSKLDYVNHDKRYIVDLKSSNNLGTYLNNRVLEYSIRDYGYNRQGAIYQHGMRQLTGYDYDYFLIFVEKDTPSGVKVVQLTESLNEGLHSAYQITERYKEFLETEQGAGYPLTILRY